MYLFVQARDEAKESSVHCLRVLSSVFPLLVFECFNCHKCLNWQGLKASAIDKLS